MKTTKEMVSSILKMTAGSAVSVIGALVTNPETYWRANVLIFSGVAVVGLFMLLVISGVELLKRRDARRWKTLVAK
jgi:hypothetical protein